MSLQAAVWDEQTDEISIHAAQTPRRVFTTKHDEMHVRDATQATQTRTLKEILSDLQSPDLKGLWYEQKLDGPGPFDEYSWQPTEPRQDAAIIHRILPRLYYQETHLQLHLDESTEFGHHTKKKKGRTQRHHAHLRLHVTFNNADDIYLTKQLTYDISR